MPYKFAKLSTQKASFIKEVATKKREVIMSEFESPTILAVLNSDGAMDAVLLVHKPTIDKLTEKALAKDSAGFWRLMSSIDDKMTQAKVAVMIYYCFKDFYPDAFDWYITQMVQAKDVPYLRGERK